MLTWHSFLQSVVLFVKALAVKVKKEQYRTSSVVMAGAVVIAIVTFGANGFGGSGRNAMAAPRIQESAEEPEEPEEEVVSGGSSFVTEAKIQFGLLNTDSEGQHLAGALLEQDVREKQRREAAAQTEIEALQKQTASYQSNQRESQKNANIWQLKHHDLQQKNDDLQKQVEELQKQLDSARQLNTSSLSTPASDLVREAKLEAGKILADARLYAESAEKELKQQADSQKNRMAENARSIASGVMLVRERLARVDERLSAATLDLDGLTQAIYQALDQTEAELKELGTDMRSFAQGTPETDPPAPLPPRPAAAQAPAAKPADRLRVKAKKAQPAHHMPPAPAHRLRNTRRPVSQLLQDQIDRLNGEEQ